MTTSLVLMSVLILTVANFAAMGDASSLFKFAYAQTPDPGANPDPTAGDNFTDMGMPGDNSTDPSMPTEKQIKSWAQDCSGSNHVCVTM